MAISSFDMATAPKPSRLESLPAELRNRIYNLVVVKDSSIPIAEDGRTHGAAKVLFTARQPTLALVNRNVRCEVLPIYYGENTFCTDSLSRDSMTRDLSQWLQQIEPHVRHIRSVSTFRPDSSVAYVAACIDHPGGAISFRVNLLLAEFNRPCSCPLRTVQKQADRGQLKHDVVLQRMMLACLDCWIHSVSARLRCRNGGCMPGYGRRTETGREYAPVRWQWSE